MEGSYKATKGLIRIKAEVESGYLRKILISGDFFMHPEDKLWNLEKFLIGTKISRDNILLKIKKFYESTGVLTPGVLPEDFTRAIMKTISCSA